MGMAWDRRLPDPIIPLVDQDRFKGRVSQVQDINDGAKDMEVLEPPGATVPEKECASMIIKAVVVIHSSNIREIE